MAVERVEPTFDDIASIVASLTEDVGVVTVSKIPIKYNLREGKAFPPEELKNDKVTQIFSEEVIKTYREHVEQAISMKAQLELLKKLHPNKQLDFDELTITTARIKNGFDSIMQKKSTIEPFRLFSISNLPTRQEAAVCEILQEHGIDNIRSREDVDSIMEKIEKKSASLLQKPKI